MKRWNEKYHDKFKWHSLSGQLMDLRNLEAAWKKVRANHGTGGIDGETIEGFEAQKELGLAEIRRLLKERRYGPKPVRRVYIPKPDGRQRPLGIPTVKDRVVQQVLKDILEPIFEEIFLEGSHGYRAGKDAHQAMRKVRGYLGRGYHWLVDADIQGFFDHVDHDIMMDLVREKVADGRVLDLLEAFLKCGVMADGDYEATEEGTPQGGVISPLLANIYLNHFDRRMGEEGYLLLRYADDFLIFCKSRQEAENALSTAERILGEELKLGLSPRKTRIFNADGCYGEFLGFLFTKGEMAPSKKAIDRYKNSIRRGTRRCQPRNARMVIEGINPVIRGWGRYFGYMTVVKPFILLDRWTRARVRSYKAQRRSRRVITRCLPEEEYLVSLVSLRTQKPATCNGERRTRAVYSKWVRTVR
ncbi:MAG: group II intron reverse transcriptase/maturase [Euryarchaeota archaeon]|nr:group II intron reverse transcriptase/maturase [Euryarchaeota archaeon]